MICRQVKAPWVKMFFYGDYDTYIVPGMDYVTLGGCRQYDSYKEDIDKYDSAAIWERCTELLPNLKSCQVVREASGLRPHRDPVRVEKDFFLTKTGKQLKVSRIHKWFQKQFAPSAVITSNVNLFPLDRPPLWTWGLWGHDCSRHSQICAGISGRFLAKQRRENCGETLKFSRSSVDPYHIICIAIATGTFWLCNIETV